MSVIKVFVKDILGYLPAKLLPALTALITTPILTRLLIPVEYGHWALATGISEFLLALATSGFGGATIRYYPFYKAKSETGVFFAVLGISVGAVVTGVSVISLGVLYLLKSQLSSTLYSLLLIAVLVFVVQAFFTVLLSVVRSDRKSVV